MHTLIYVMSILHIILFNYTCIRQLQVLYQVHNTTFNILIAVGLSSLDIINNTGPMFFMKIPSTCKGSRSRSLPVILKLSRHLEPLLIQCTLLVFDQLVISWHEIQQLIYYMNLVSLYPTLTIKSHS